MAPTAGRRKVEMDTPQMPQLSGIPETMTFDEAMERYDGEWLVVRVLSEDTSHRPVDVQVAARCTDRREARRAWERLRESDNYRQPKLCLLEAGPRLRTGEEARRALAALAARDDPELDELAGRGVWIGAER